MKTTLFLSLAYGFLLFLGGLLLKPFIILFTILFALGAAFALRNPSQSPWIGPYRAIGMLALMPVALAGYLAPFRHIVLFLLARTEGPTAVEVARLLLPGPGFETFAGASGVWFGVCALILEARWFWRHSWHSRLLPTAAARSAAIGLCELRGRARRIGKPLDGFPPEAVLGHRVYTVKTSDANEVREESRLPPFYLEDGTGRILVDPKEAKIRTSWSPLFFGVRFCEVAVTKRREELSMGERRQFIADGDPVYVLGRVETRADAPEAVDSERLVVRAPKALPFFDSLLSNVTLGLADAGMGDVFFLSDTDEAQARKYMRRAVLAHAAVAALWVGLSLRQMDYVPPERWFRGKPSPYAVSLI